jgi:hypothetical protein
MTGTCFISTAEEIGEGLDGKPRQSRIFFIASGGLIAHKIRIRPPQRSLFNTEQTRTMKL